MSLGSLFNALLVLIGAYVYVSLARQISARPAATLSPVERSVGVPEAAVAMLLVGWFLVNITAGKVPPPSVMRTRDLAATAIFALGLLLFLVAFLRWRGIKIIAAAGFSKIGFGRVLSTAAVLLFAALPLIFLADTIVQRVLGSGSSKQEIVEMFNGSQNLEQRVVIIVLAVAVAPIAEEFMFRFFLYGVLRHYFGRAAGLVITGLLFAGVHMHLPSLGPLFVLATCFTLAYEWSGSILVAMTMHALFNALSLTALAFPQTLSP